MSRPMKDHYKTLGVSPDATPEQILKARNRLLRRHHPDRNPDREEEAGKITVDILLAAEVLLDGHQRAEYDKSYRLYFGTTPKVRRAAREREAEGEREYIFCPSCGKRNMSSARNYCIFCGGGIGENPEPFDRSRVEVLERLFKDMRYSSPDSLSPWSSPLQSCISTAYGMIFFVWIIVVAAYLGVLILDRDETGFYFLIYIVALIVLSVAAFQLYNYWRTGKKGPPKR